jgi:hypothetical protein
MKKILYSLSLYLLAMACKQRSDQFTLTATSISATGDVYVYDMAENKVIDTIQATGGDFVYSCTSEGDPKLLLITDNETMTAM